MWDNEFFEPINVGNEGSLRVHLLNTVAKGDSHNAIDNVSVDGMKIHWRYGRYACILIMLYVSYPTYFRLFCCIRLFFHREITQRVRATI